MLKTVAFSALALVLAGTNFAAAGSDLLWGKNGRVTYAASPPAMRYVPPAPPPSGQVTIFSNLGKKYPKGVYACCNGFGIQGPLNNLGAHQLWDAMAFTSDANHTLSRIDVGVTWSSGTNKIVIALYDDAGGKPGNLIKSWNAKNMPAFPTCCGLTSVKDSTGITLTAGTQYWVAVETSNSAKDTIAIWTNNTTDQVDGVLISQFCSNDQGGTSCGGDNDQWTEGSLLLPALSFAVYGSD
jgi:hypothetical protein